MMKAVKITTLVFAAVSLQSCLTVKDYQQPQVFDEDSFKSSAVADSLSLAHLPWQTIFTDVKLQNYIHNALENNNDIRIAIENISQAKSAVSQGRAAYYPSLSAAGNYSHTVNSLNTQIGQIIGQRQHLDLYELDMTLGWEADIWGKITSQKKANEATYLRTVAAHQAVRTQLISSVASAYFQLLALDEQKEITLKTIENRKQSLETNKDLKDAGIVTEVAVVQTEALLLNAQALLLDIENSIKIQENALCILLGELPHDIDRNTLDVQQIPIDPDEGVAANLIHNRPDIIAAEMSFRNAFELTNVARASFYPSLTLTANGGIQSIDFAKLFDASSLFGSILGGLTQPIFNGRQIKTQYEISQSNKEIALYNYKQAILLASQEVSDALYTFKANEEKAIIKDKEAKAYTKAVSYSEELLNYGMANYIEVLTAKENELAAELSVVTSKFAKLNSLIQLYKAVGGGIN